MKTTHHLRLLESRLSNPFFSLVVEKPTPSSVSPNIPRSEGKVSCSHIPGEKPHRIFEDLQGLSETRQRSLNTRIFKESFKDLQRSS